MSETRPCPSCGKDIPLSAVRCRHCGTYTSDEARAQGVEATEAVRAAAMPPPPGLPWFVVLILAVLTCGLFLVVWLGVQGMWAKKVDGTNVLPFLAGWVAALVVSIAAMGTGLDALAQIAAGVCLLISAFKIKDAIEASPVAREMRLEMSGVATFFLGAIYLQFKLDEIRKRMAGR